MHVILFVGYSGGGKTHLIEKAVRALSGAGVELGVLKHVHSAHPLDFDRKGKDTWRFYKSGAKMVIASHREGMTVMKRLVSRPAFGKEVLKEFGEAGIGCVFVEGFYDELALAEGVTSVVCAASLRDAFDLMSRHPRAKILCVTGRVAKRPNQRTLGRVPLVTTDTAVKMIQTMVHSPQ